MGTEGRGASGISGSGWVIEGREGRLYDLHAVEAEKRLPTLSATRLALSSRYAHAEYISDMLMRSICEKF